MCSATQANIWEGRYHLLHTTPGPSPPRLPPQSCLTTQTVDAFHTLTALTSLARKTGQHRITTPLLRTPAHASRLCVLLLIHQRRLRLVIGVGYGDRSLISVS